MELPLLYSALIIPAAFNAALLFAVLILNTASQKTAWLHAALGSAASIGIMAKIYLSHIGSAIGPFVLYSFIVIIAFGIQLMLDTDNLSQWMGTTKTRSFLITTAILTGSLSAWYWTAL